MLEADTQLGGGRGDSDGEDDAEEINFMALLYDRAQLGVAIYNALTTTLKILQVDVRDSAELEQLLERLYTQFEVHKVVISSRNASTNAMLRMVKRLGEQRGVRTGVTVRKHSDFTYTKARQVIESVRIGHNQDDGTSPVQISFRWDTTKYLRSHFDFEKVQMIRASGALLLYLVTEKIGNQLEDEPCSFLASVEQVALDGIMFIDNSALRSLQVFSHESHPSVVKGRGRGKEGFSLFGLLNRTVTRAGALLLRRWMLAPLVDKANIDQRLDAVGFFCASQNDDIRQFLYSKLKDFRDVEGIFRRVKKRVATVKDWCRFITSIHTFTVIQERVQEIVCESAGGDLPGILEKVANERGVLFVRNLLGNVIDFDESIKEESVIIRSGVSEVLDAARARYEDLDNVLTEVAYQIQESSPSLSSITVQYIPQVGYVICCDSPTTLPDFVFQFQEDDTTFYYKDGCCRDLDASIGDIFGYIMDIQREILEELIITLLDHEPSVHEVTDIISQVDCFISLATCARNLNFSRPEVAETNCLKATKARHPLQELLVDTYIPNDISVETSKTNGLIQIVTGQNGSGKSVYLKMVGVLQYLAQIGSFIPAENAKVGLVDRILTRIHSLETAAASQSSFTIDCNQIARMLQPYTQGRSLFLIDEFGKGTAELDGAALLSAVINHLATAKSNGNGRPRVILTTHFLEIFRHNLLDPAILQSGVRSTDVSPVVCMVMSSMNPPTASDDALAGATPVAVPLYELCRGISDHSNAFGCAAKCGISPEIIRRASEVLEFKRNNTAIMPPCRSQNRGPTPEEQLLAVFTSVDDWTTASDEALDNLLAVARMGDRESSS